MMGIKERAFAPLAAGLAGGPRPGRPLLPPPGAHARPGLRARPGPRRLRRDRAAEHRPGRLLQAPARPLLRGAALRAPAHAGGGRPAQPALVPGLRPDRAAARPLQPDPHPGPLRAGRLPPLLRGHRRAVRRARAWSGARSSTSTRPRSRPTPRSTRCTRASPSRPTSAHLFADPEDGPPGDADGAETGDRSDAARATPRCPCRSR